MTDGRKRYVSTWIWSDPWYFRLQKDEKYLFLYLLTNSNANIAGIYEIQLEKIELETKLSIDEINKILSRFETDNKVLYYHDTIIIKNFTKHQKLSPKAKIRIGIDKLLISLHDDIYREAVKFGYVYQYLSDIDAHRSGKIVQFPYNEAKVTYDEDDYDIPL